VPIFLVYQNAITESMLLTNEMVHTNVIIAAIILVRGDYRFIADT